jgi:fumarylpyruvate hydrolase
MNSILYTQNWSFTNGLVLPVGTLYGIGRNYSDHAAEMGTKVHDIPIVFIKPPSAYCANNSEIELPLWTSDVHHELELVVVIGADANSISVKNSASVIAGLGVGLDLTARDVQANAKKLGHPWAVAKGWKNSAPVSNIVPYSQCGSGPWDIALTVNEIPRQHTSTEHMENSIEELISYLSEIFTLRAGDAIFTGTPSGVARVHRGDAASATLNDLTSLTVRFI